MAETKKREICNALREYWKELVEDQKRSDLGPDAAFKLNVHFPTVTAIAERLYPEDFVLHTAADLHDCGRIPQLLMTGSFNDGAIGSETDHRVIDYKMFHQEMKKFLVESGLISDEEFDQNAERGFLGRIGQSILLHGLRGKVPDKVFDGLYLDAELMVDKVSLIDDVVNGTQCAGYLLRECQEQAKNVSKGGFIPDENADLRTVSPKVMQLFAESEAFNRNAECKTYPDYVLFGAFLATRSLKSYKTRAEAYAAMQQPITVWHYVDGVLVATEHENALAALEWTFDAVMDATYACSAKRILRSYFERGCAPA